GGRAGRARRVFPGHRRGRPGRGGLGRGRGRLVALPGRRTGPGPWPARQFARRRGPPGGDNGPVMSGHATNEPVEPELSPEVAERTSGLRTGWTTGTCASAAAKAAAIGLCTGVRPETVEVGLPGGERVMFPVETGPSGEPFEAVVVKDAGDDPDCTDGARMTATVAFAAPPPAATDNATRSGAGP